MYDEVYRTLTGTSPKTARVITSLFWAGSETGSLLAENFGYIALIPEAAANLLQLTLSAADAATMKKEIFAEHQRLGALPEELEVGRLMCSGNFQYCVSVTADIS